MKPFAFVRGQIPLQNVTAELYEHNHKKLQLKAVD